MRSMETQFSKWSYDLNEGVTAIPFVMAQAPAETHDRLIKIDRKLWAAQSEHSTEGSTLEDTTRAATIQGLESRNSELSTAIKHTGVTRENNLDKGNSSSNDTTLTKRAALIAKRKAVGNNPVIATKSASQRRSAISKNKNRRSIMPSPPPSTRKQDPQSVAETKLESAGEQNRPNILILSQDESQQQRDVQLAIQDQRIDFNNSQQLKELMDKLGVKPVDNSHSEQ
ncbi:hypothetical protein N0V94_004357 [Neodidymelliopsis sp. IMI 364377]|nr:hypothetical protein N0V94_004357 [Neodidymelliopsis sp. IMI 364377]